MRGDINMPYRAAVSFVRWVLRVFFRKMEVTGIENVPEEGGGLVISWHPNALIDAALILIFFPQKIVFGARHGLFSWPLLGRLMRALGTVPVYRRQDFPGGDDDARRTANQKSLDALASALAGGAFCALFPEGDSHDEPAPTELKTGAARLYYRAKALAATDAPPPVIIPVGLHYDKKRVFGSSALVAIHLPLELSAGLSEPPPPDASYDDKRARYRELTDALEATLHEVVHATKSWEHHHALHRVRKIMRAERAHRVGATLKRPDMKERVLAFSRLVPVTTKGSARIRKRSSGCLLAFSNTMKTSESSASMTTSSTRHPGSHRRGSRPLSCSRPCSCICSCLPF